MSGRLLGWRKGGRRIGVEAGDVWRREVRLWEVCGVGAACGGCKCGMWIWMWGRSLQGEGVHRRALWSEAEGGSAMLAWMHRRQRGWWRVKLHVWAWGLEQCSACDELSVDAGLAVMSQ
ncbi:uncharacterized protein [Physcomitrium patens]|uniref:uncharacterized protein n=1 Tax=Physcomitrium patens TaxID=3218 RepID=UPI003CCD87CB